MVVGCSTDGSTATFIAKLVQTFGTGAANVASSVC